MAKGGKRPGAGRPKGSFTRPQIRDYFTDDEVHEMVEMLKTYMVDDMNLLKFAVEQVFGKAPQQLEIGGIDGEPLEANLSKSDRKAIDSLRDLLKKAA
jgi:hypothetical protein